MKAAFSLFLLCSILLFGGCENNDLLLSEKKLNNDIQRTWEVVTPRPGQELTPETWTFANGSLTINYRTNNVDKVATGYYSIDADFTKAYAKLSGFSYTGFLASGLDQADINRDWVIAVLKDGVLYLSAHDDSGTLRSVEFIEK